MTKLEPGTDEAKTGPCDSHGENYRRLASVIVWAPRS